MILFINLLNCKSDFIFETQGSIVWVYISQVAHTRANQHQVQSVDLFFYLITDPMHYRRVSFSLDH